MLIRSYQPGDGEKISNLLTQHTTYQRDAAFWLWINRIWPVSPSIVAVAEENNEIAGHYAILPMDLQLDGMNAKCGLGIHAFISPKYRGKVPIFHISKKCYDLARDAGIQLVWGFPNENYRMIQEKVEGWTKVQEFKLWTKAAGSKILTQLTLNLISKDSADDLLKLNDFLESCQLPFDHGIKPSLRLWLDRFVNHPQNEYSFHFAMHADETVAALVTKVYVDPHSGSRHGHLIDYCFKDMGYATQTIHLLESYFADKVDLLGFWPGNSILQTSLKQSGFKPDGFSTFFGFKILDSELKSKTDILADSSNWNLTMAMSDVF